MKTIICLAGLLLAVNFPANAALFQYGTLGGGSAIGTIADNNTIGLTDAHAVSMSPLNSITALTLTVVLQGGFASDLTGYLRLGNTTSSPFYSLTSLINSQTLSASTPNTYTMSFSSTGNTTFIGSDPNNTWTLFFADTSAGGTTTLNGWSLDVTAAAVPEPVNVALGIFGVIAVGVVAWKRRGLAVKDNMRASATS
jgi:subtilisin-like proprotein convertase family protein